jgi:hypothetical protein
MARRSGGGDAMRSDDTAVTLDALRVYRERLRLDLADMHSRNAAMALCDLLRRTLDTVERLIGELS